MSSVLAVEVGGRYMGLVVAHSGGYLGMVSHPRGGVLPLEGSFQDDLEAADAVRDAYLRLDRDPSYHVPRTPRAMPGSVVVAETVAEVVEMDVRRRHVHKVGTVTHQIPTDESEDV